MNPDATDSGSDRKIKVEYRDWQRAEMLEFVSPRALRVLDVGCSFGGFGHLLKSERPGVVVDGVEPDGERAQIAAQRLDHVQVAEFPNDILLRGPKYDSVVFNDVLEHLVDPWSALLAAREIVTRSGQVVASIPNVRNWGTVRELVFQGRFRYRPAGVLDVTHLRFFTRDSIVDLFDTCGFKIDVMKPISRITSLKVASMTRFGPDILRDLGVLQFGLCASPTS